MTNEQLNLWWSDRTMPEKLHIANKVAAKDNPGTTIIITSPQAATSEWLALPQSRKQHIFEHCNADHDFVIHEEKQGYTFSY